MKIDFDYLENLYDEEPQVKMMRKTKIVDDSGENKKIKKGKKNFNIAREFKYEGYN
jgi:hypothetical protein